MSGIQQLLGECLFLHIRNLKAECSFGVMNQIWGQKTEKVMYKGI